MSKIILGMTMSLDGFINDQNGSVERLYPDLDELRKTRMLQESIKTTGAVVMGRHAFEMGDPDWYAGNYEFQVLCDEIHLGIMPILLGDGLRLFENIDTEHIKLEKVKEIDSTPDRTDIILICKWNLPPKKNKKMKNEGV